MTNSPMAKVCPADVEALRKAFEAWYEKRPFPNSWDFHTGLAWDAWKESDRQSQELAALIHDNAQYVERDSERVREMDRLRKCEAALRELVACHELREKLRRIEPTQLTSGRNYHAEELRDEYDQRKALAWAAARAALELE